MIAFALKSMRKRYAILIILAAVVGYSLLDSFALSELLPNRIAEDPTIKGKGNDGQCMDYALAVSSKLAANSFSIDGTSEIRQLPVVMSLWCTV